MKYKKGLIFICLIICLFSIAGVCAGDVNDTAMASDNACPAIEEADDETISEVDEAAISSSQDEIIRKSDNGTFSALKKKINDADAGSTIELENDYAYDDGFSADGIRISKPLTIDGKGYTVDAKSQSRAFYISSAVTFKNITFINCFAHSGGAIYNDESDNSIVISCDFINCSKAIYNEGVDFAIISCDFINCFGGAVNNYATNCSIGLCDFINCSEAIYNIGEDFAISSCDFINCSREAIFSCAFNCSIGACDFISCCDGAINAQGTMEIINCTFENFSRFSNATSIYGGVIEMTVDNSKIINCTFANCLSKSVEFFAGINGGIIHIWGDNNVIRESDFMDCSVIVEACGLYGGAVSFRGSNNVLSDSTFKNCSSQATDVFGYINGGVVCCWQGGNNEIKDSNFTQCSSLATNMSYIQGGVIYLSGQDVISNSNFIDCLSSSTEYTYGIHDWGGNGNILNSNFINCNGTLSDFKPSRLISGCNVSYSSFINCHDYNWIIANGNNYSCSFINCSTENDPDEDPIHIKVYGYAYIDDPQDYLAEIYAPYDAYGTVAVSIDGSEKLRKSLTECRYEDGVYYIGPADVNYAWKQQSYLIEVRYIGDYDDVSNSAIVSLNYKNGGGSNPNPTPSQNTNTNAQTTTTNNDNTIKLTLKTVKVKKSAKKLVLQATLKQGSKALSGKKITFKFNGKKYKATTNKKGVAKVTIKKAVLKKLKVGKKVTYQASYGKTSVKKTVKVKK